MKNLCSKLQGWGVDLADMLHPSAATKAYLDFLGDVTENEVQAETHFPGSQY